MKDYSNAYTEVYTILNHLDEEELNKIPEEIIETIEEKQNIDYIYELNEEIDLKKQAMLPETKSILFNLFRDYLSTPVQKEKILKMQQEDRRKLEEKKKQQYNDVNIFKNNEQEEKDNFIEDLHPIEKTKENIFKKILNFIKNMFLR